MDIYRKHACLVSRLSGKTFIFCLFAVLLSATSIFPASTEPAAVLPRAHSHNDYEHKRPLFDALEHGFCSIEADIFLITNQLLVAHYQRQTTPEKSLQKLYLDPLLERTRKNRGRVYSGGPPCWLFIDLKTEAEATYAALHAVLKDYEEMLTRFEGSVVKTNAITVVITGNRPRETIARQPVRYAAYDGLIADLDSDVPATLVPVVSEQWSKFFKWRGANAISTEELATLKNYIAKAHAKGRLIRWWGAPDMPAAWKVFFDAGADLINTDNHDGLQKFLIDQASSIPATITSRSTNDWGSPNMTDMEQIRVTTLKPYAGPSLKGVDVSTMTGKVLCGYQGWFGAEGDGIGRGWYHWNGRNGFKPGSCKIDLWPDVSELDADERYPTAFKLADGSAAEVYSAFNAKTVVRHFKWMRDYGIDGVFVQRFVSEVSHPKGLRQFNVVLNHCREGANLNGRTYAVMYDLSGMGSNQMQRVVNDWKSLVDRMRVTKDPAYLHHAGKPVVAVWGFGFNDGRRYTLKEGMELVRFLKEDPAYGGCTVMLGIPTYWRTLTRDTVNDPALHELIRMADVVSPWAVGRFGSPEQASRYYQETVPGDIAWCKAAGKEFLPVVFPGFSWHNMNRSAKSDAIPRLGGRFLWSQFAAAKEAGATMVYQAMFDEVDEGTAIFKCSNNPPVGESVFITYEGLPTDHYLKLVGTATRMIRGELPLTKTMPDLLPLKPAPPLK